MAEQEVIKHTKKIFGVWKTNSPFWHKVSELLLEMLIIVFAVTISIYFHDRSELKHQRHETKEFLLGLRQDLNFDKQEMNQDRESFEQSEQAFRYITHRKMNASLDRDTINKYYNRIFNTTGLVPNSGRFEGFKSSGKIGTIENKTLQNNILDLYQENIPNLLLSTTGYTFNKQKLFDLVSANTKRLTDSTTNLLEILASDQAYDICSRLTFTKEILSRYDTCILKINSIISDINKQYGIEN